MGKRIVYMRPDGGMSIVIPASNGRIGDETEDDFIARIRQNNLPLDAIDIQIVEETDIPTDRYFRNAWKHSAGAISVDMPKARDIHRDKLREMRAPKLAALDVEYMRADERGDTQTKSTVSAKKQALRDITVDPTIEAAQTPEELKAIIPDALKD